MNVQLYAFFPSLFLYIRQVRSAPSLICSTWPGLIMVPQTMPLTSLTSSSLCGGRKGRAHGWFTAGKSTNTLTQSLPTPSTQTHCHTLSFFEQRRDWTDRCPHHHGNSVDADGGGRTCVSPPDRPDSERTASNDDPNAGMDALWAQHRVCCLPSGRFTCVFWFGFFLWFSWVFFVFLLQCQFRFVCEAILKVYRDKHKTPGH